MSCLVHYMFYSTSAPLDKNCSTSLVCYGQDWVEYNNYEYYVNPLVEDQLTWHQARDFCQQRYGELVSIQDTDERDFVVQQVYKDYITIFFKGNAHLFPRKFKVWF